MLVAIYAATFHDPPGAAVTHLDEDFSALAGYFLLSWVAVVINLVEHRSSLKRRSFWGFDGYLDMDMDDEFVSEEELREEGGERRVLRVQESVETETEEEERRVLRVQVSVRQRQREKRGGSSGCKRVW